MTTKATDYPRAPLTQAGQALESSRDSGFDLSTAVGELVDNAYEAKANLIRIRTVEDADKHVVELAAADDGVGIPPEVLAHALSLGYSSRYGSRLGLGRFGMGLKLASLSHARRVEIYSRPHGQDKIFHTYLDLQEVSKNTQRDLFVAEVTDWPEAFAELMTDPAKGQSSRFGSGTLVVWKQIDRLQRGGRYGSSLDERLQGLTKFLARAYRQFIDKGLRIELDDLPVTLHDPLFLLENPRVTKKFGKDLRAEIIDEGKFEIEGHQVEWTVTLLPETLRHEKGAGGRATKGREEFADLYIPDNERKMSILRNGREIYYDLVPRLYPGSKDKVDRYIGVQISFPAALDEYFQVRNVKRGAEPVSKLREEIRKAIANPINAARKKIRDHWKSVDQQKQLVTGDGHLPAHEAADDFELTAPSGRANLDATLEQVQQTLDQVAVDIGLETGDPSVAQKAKWIRDSFEKRAITLVDAQWPGKDLLEITHLTGKAVVKVNNRHPFIEEMIRPLRAMAAMAPEDLDPVDVSELLKKLEIGIDVLLIAYAKAENMRNDPEDAYGELRSHWGIFSNALVRHALKR